jgi:predicted RNA binding protein YcfA (HicA-like mRNA interferase family)
MPQVPLLRPREVVRVFESLGWQAVRQRGSHILLTKPGVLRRCRCRIIHKSLAELCEL